MMIKEIVIINDFGFVNGGASEVAISSARALADRGYKVTFFCGKANYEPNLLHSNIDLITLGQEDLINNKIKGLFYGIWNKKSYNELKKVLKNKSIDDTVVHVHGWTKVLSVSIINYLKKSGFKFIITLHDYFAICPNGGLYNYKKNCICGLNGNTIQCLTVNCDSRSMTHKLWRYLRGIIQYNLALKHSMNFIYISENNKNIVLENRKEKHDNFYFLRNPVNTTRMERVQVEQNDIYSIVGRISKEKGHDLLAQVGKDQDYKIAFVGDGNYKSEILNINPNIIITGWLNRQQLEKFYKSVRVLLVPSRWYEGMPLVIYEAMSKGIPVITSDICNARETIIHNETGLIFENENLKSLSNILNLTKDDRFIRKLSENCYNLYWENQYSLENHVEDLIGIYKILK